MRDAAAVGLAVGAYGVGFGATAVAGGLSVAQTCATSLLIFTGASQFALVSVLAAGGGVAAGLSAALLLGARNTLYAVRLRALLPRRLAGRLAAAHLVIDESTAMATGGADETLGRWGFWSTGISVYICWNVATLIGATAGSVLGDPRRLGLDAAFPAAFLALLWPRLADRAHLRVALAGTVIALALVGVAPPGLPVLAAALGVVVARR